MPRHLNEAWDLSRRAGQHYGTSTLSRFLRLARLRVFRGFGIDYAASYGLLDPKLVIDGETIPSFAEYQRYLDLLNPRDRIHQVDDKARLALACQRFDLRCPRTIGLWKRDGKVELMGDATFDETDVETFLQALPEAFVVKPRYGAGGFAVHLFERDGTAFCHREFGRLDGPELLATFARVYAERDALVQEKAVSHPELARLLDTEVLGCVRVTTLVKGAEAEILFSMLKFPGQGMDVDNYGTGNEGQLLSEVETASGALDVPIGNHPSGFGMSIAEPGSSIEQAVRGRPFPLWPATRDLALRAALSFPELRCLGWDIAVTPTGPVLIEGNTRWGMPWRHETYRRVARALVEAC